MSRIEAKVGGEGEAGLPEAVSAIPQVDRRLADWVKTTVGPVAVSLAEPRPDSEGPTVGLYLLELLAAPPPSGTRRPPLQLSLRYLVTTWAPSPEEAHRLVGELVFAAMGEVGWEVEFVSAQTPIWAAFGIVPRPAFFLRVPLRKERPMPPVKWVKSAVVRTVPVGTLQGVVLGPQDVPLAGARVDLPVLRTSTRTDLDGRFRFGAVPAEGPLTVRVSAQGREASVEVTAEVGRSEEIVIRLREREA